MSDRIHGDVVEGQAERESASESIVKAECIFCKMETSHSNDGANLWCKRCGQASEDNRKQITNDAYIDRLIKEQSAVASTGPRTKLSRFGIKKLLDADPIRKKKAKIQDKIDDLERKLENYNSPPKDKTVENKIRQIKKELEENKKEYNRSDNTPSSIRQFYLQESLGTPEEKQYALNKRRVTQIIESLTNDKTLRQFTETIWRKTLRLKLQTGRYVLANILACLIIAAKYHTKRSFAYDDILDKLIEQYSPGKYDIPRWILKKQIFQAQSLIYKKLLPPNTSKTPCNVNKESGKLDTVLFDGKADWLKNGCTRSDWKIPVIDHNEEIEAVIQELIEQKTIECSDTILERTKTIFDGADEKALVSGRKSKTIIASVIYLAFLEKNVNVSYIDFIDNEAIKASESGVKKLCKAINDELKLGIQLKF